MNDGLLVIARAYGSVGFGLWDLNADYDSMECTWLETVNDYFMDFEMLGTTVWYAVLNRLLGSTLATCKKCCCVELFPGLNEISSNRHRQVAGALYVNGYFHKPNLSLVAAFINHTALAVTHAAFPACQGLKNPGRGWPYRSS